MKVLETEYKGFKVDDNGNVYGKRGKVLKGRIDRCGYKEVCLSLKGKQKNILVHRLILKTFNPCDNMDNLDVNHINGDKTDNRLINLEWCTRSENIKHSYKNKLQDNATNQYGNFKVVSDEEVKLMIQLRNEGMTQKEISNIVGHSIRTIRKYLKRGM